HAPGGGCSAVRRTPSGDGGSLPCRRTAGDGGSVRPRRVRTVALRGGGPVSLPSALTRSRLRGPESSGGAYGDRVFERGRAQVQPRRTSGCSGRRYAPPLNRSVENGPSRKLPVVTGSKGSITATSSATASLPRRST